MGERGGVNRGGREKDDMTHPPDHVANEPVSSTEVVWVPAGQQLMQHLHRHSICGVCGV